MKKRIIAIALTLALTAAMAVPAPAATITEDSDSQSGTTTLSIGVQPSYSVIIPPSIDAVTAFGGAYSASQFVTARDVQLAEGDVLVVDLSSDFKMTLQGGTDTLDYTMTAGPVLPPRISRRRTPKWPGSAVLTRTRVCW